MNIYLKYNTFNDSKKSEYEQTQFIYNNMCKLYYENKYKNILDIFNNTMRITDYIYARNKVYWYEFTKFLNWKLTN